MGRREEFQQGGSSRVRLYHWGGLGEKGRASVQEQGLMPFRERHPDFYDDEEWTEDHDRVWAFTTPDRGEGVTALGGDRVTFEVPDEDIDVRRGKNVVGIPRTVRPDEILDIDTPEQ